MPQLRQAARLPRLHKGTAHQPQYSWHQLAPSIGTQVAEAVWKSQAPENLSVREASLPLFGHKQHDSVPNILPPTQVKFYLRHRLACKVVLRHLAFQEFLQEGAIRPAVPKRLSSCSVPFHCWMLRHESTGRVGLAKGKCQPEHEAGWSSSEMPKACCAVASRQASL